MSKELIVSADDYGLSEAYDLGAIKAYREGVASVLSLLVNTDEAARAVELRNRSCPDAPLALHVNFCTGRPVSDPSDIPTLVNEREGSFTEVLNGSRARWETPSARAA